MSADPLFTSTVPISSWHDCHSSEHFVQFYEDDAILVDAVVEYVADGLKRGAAAVVVATAEHLQTFERKWSGYGLDVAAARDAGRYVALDAEATLGRFLQDGWPQREAFFDVIGPVVADAAKRGQGVVAFGEMVALLWQKRQYGAAVELEALWNELAGKHRFKLFCAYPLGDDQHAPIEALQKVCRAHSTAIPAESYNSLVQPAERLAAICELQNKALLLEGELAARIRVERQLARRELELSDFLENGIHPLHSVGPDGTILWANRAELDMLGYAAEEYIGRNIREFHVDPAAIESVLTRLLGGETLRDVPARVRGKNGAIRYVVISSNCLWENGSFVHTRCFTRDITQQVHAETAQREQEAMLQLAMGVAKIGAWVFDVESGKLQLSCELERMLGYDAGGFPGSFADLEAFVHPADREPLARALRGAVGKRSVIHVELRFRRAAAGDWLCLEMRGGAVEAESRSAVRLHGIVIDVTERQRTEELRSLAAAIVESSDDAIISKTLDGVITSWNRGAERLFGYSAEEMIGRPITTLIPEESIHEEQEILEKLSRGERVDHFETGRVAKDGRRLDVSISISPVRNAHGVIVGASKVARNISERKQAERALREQERLLQAETAALAKLNELSTRLWRAKSLAEGLGEMLRALIELVGADKGNIQLLDPARGVLRIEAQRGFEQAFLDYFREVSPEDDSACGRALRLRERVIIEDLEADGLYEPMRPVARAADFRAVISTPLIGADGHALGIASTHFRRPHRPGEQQLRRLDLYLRQASDFIQRCHMEDALRSNARAMQEADRRKDEFLALLAHELRNPLAPIRYALATGKKSARSPEQARRADEIIDRQVSHMSRLLDDLLDVSRITRGTLELKKCRTELTAVIATAIESARPILDKKKHTLSVELPNEPIRLDADPVRLAQVFSNLLINAAKYTDPGGQIVLTAARDRDEIAVRVRDNGIGISPQMLPRLFTMFSQAEAALTRSEGGLGIGLALAHGLIELHEGVITAHSAASGHGSEFVVRLPLPAVVESTEAQDSAQTGESVPSRRILVVDDNRDSATTCGAFLESCGHDVQVTFSGRSALAIAEDFRPHVVILDIGMPELDGYEVARRLRARPWAESCQLIAVTGWGQGKDKELATAAGFDLHLTKPVDPAVLEPLLAKVASH